MNYSYFHKQQSFPPPQSYISAISETLLVIFCKEKRSCASKIQSLVWNVFIHYKWDQNKMTRGMEGTFPLKCSENKRSPDAICFLFSTSLSASLSLLRQTIAVVFRPTFHRKAHKWKHPNPGNLIPVTNSTFPKEHLKTSLFVPSD